MWSVYNSAPTGVCTEDGFPRRHMTEQHVIDRAHELFGIADFDHKGEASASRLRVVLRRSKWPKFIHYDIEQLLRRIPRDAARDTVMEDSFCSEFCEFYHGWLQDDEMGARAASGLLPQITLKSQSPRSNSRTTYRQASSAVSSSTGNKMRLRRSSDPSSSKPSEAFASQMGSSDRALPQIRRIWSDVGPGQHLNQHKQDLKQMPMRWSTDGVPSSESSESQTSFFPVCDKTSKKALQSESPRNGRMARDRHGAKPAHFVAGSQGLNRLVGSSMFEPQTVTTTDMAQFLHIFIDMDVSANGTVSRDSFMAHLSNRAPHLCPHAMRLYDRALESSIKKRMPSLHQSKNPGGGVKPLNALSFRKLLHCVFPAASDADIDELCKMAQRVRLVSKGKLGRTYGRDQPKAFRRADPQKLFQEWNTSESGYMTVDECFEGMDTWIKDGEYALTFNEIRYSIEELYRVDDGKEREAQSSYLRGRMNEVDYVHSVTLPEFVAWVKTRTKNTAALY